MPWRLGIDEAGYGPNLGPLVMSAVACRVDGRHAGRDLWQILEKVVCKAAKKLRGLPVDDSKLVHGARGVAGLELTVLAFAQVATDREVTTLTELLEILAPEATADLANEVWFTGNTLLPVYGAPEAVREASVTLAECCAREDVCVGPLHSVLYCAERFNAVVEETHTKASVLGLGLAQLVQSFLAPGRDEEISVFVDKHGGRNHYSAIVQHAVGAAMVIPTLEGALASHYEVTGRSLRFSFLPRADSVDFCVALASMVSKYLRELLMLEFNDFWQKEVPGVKATAGYPVDALRFFTDIGPARTRLNLPDRVLWRQR